VSVVTRLRQARNRHLKFPTSFCELSDVNRRLRLSHLRSKPAVMQVIVDDFVKESAQFLDLSTSSPSYLRPRDSVFDYFNSRYGDIVFKAFRDLRTSVQFALTQNIFIDYLHLYEDTWLASSFKEMSHKVGRLSKDDVLDCLHFIPSHLRPSYNTRSVCSCRNALLRHICLRISYLSSLSSSQFLDVYCCVFPFDTDDECRRFLLTERVLYVEYGERVISSLSTPLLSVNNI
jgi:hypothetical protein